MTTETLDVVINPRAGAGRAGRVLAEVTRALQAHGRAVRVHRTERPGHAGELMRKLISQGSAKIAVVGGDGSFHDAVQGLCDASGNLVASDTTLALIPAGTGGDLRKTLGVPTEPRAVAEWLCESKPKKMDLGRMDFVDHRGKSQSKLFANIASFGVSGVVDKLVNESPKWLGGKLTFFLGTLRASAIYENVACEVRADGELFYQGPAYAVCIANGRYFGGGMKVAPNADPFDGQLDVVILGDMTRIESTLLARTIYQGEHLKHRKVTHRRATRVTCTLLGEHDALIDADGEAPGKLPAEFSVLPGVLSVLVGA